MTFIWPHKLPATLWNAFIKDSLRIYALLPKKLKAAYFAVFFLQAVSAIVETTTLLVISLFAMSIAAPEAVMNHFLVKPFLENVPFVASLVTGPRQLVTFTSCLMILFIFLKNSLFTVTNYSAAHFSEKVALHIGRESVRRYLNKSYYWHISEASASVIHKIILRYTLANYTRNVLYLYSNILCSTLLFISLFIAQPYLTFVVIVCFGLSSLILYASIRRSIDRAGQLVSSTALEEQMTMTAMTKGIREIITYHRQNTALKKMLSAVELGLKPRAFNDFAMTIPSGIMDCVGFGTIGGMVIFLLMKETPMEEIVAAASMRMLTAWRILPAVTRCLNLSVSIRGLKPRAMLCLELLETFAKESAGVSPEPDPNFAFKRSLDLIDASFRYPDKTHEAISNVSLSIKKGRNVGFIGPSGAGKSTLALLLSGLVAPTDGAFEVDGRTLDPAAQASFLLKLGYVPQTPLLMDGTLAENVAFSKWGEEFDRQKVLEACKLAAMDFVIKEPESLDQPISSASGRLSGGEAQRVSIARALFAQPEIVIFDEATSSLDQANENIIRNTINRIKGRITSIIIAHRLSTVEDCDEIYWIEDGRVKMHGPPSELLPLYEEMLKSLTDETLDGEAADQNQTRN
ncbi:MAG: ABC transporter ATP-binding protein/permease [Deltaproteobacteria bacterium]|nr:ABC transporter ATP-binding protein/permease [Deltaproteobacteria bacterium]